LPERMGLNEHFWGKLPEMGWDKQGIPPGTDYVRRFNLDIRSAAWFWCPGPRPDLERRHEETAEWFIGRGDWGQTHKWWKNRSGTPEHMAFLINSPEVWRREFREQILGLRVRDRLKLDELRQKYAAAMATDQFVTYDSGCFFEELRRILGDEYMLEALLTEPEFIHDFLTIICAKYIEYYELLFAEVGRPDGIYIYEDLGYTRAAFASPQCHREMILPYHKKLFGVFKDHQLPIIFHTCGDFRVHLPAIIEAGADCIQAMEAKTGMDVLDLARQYAGQLCWMGNVDVRVLESGDRAAIERAALAKLNGMRALREPYVFMSDHSITPAVKVADYEFFLDVFWKNCRY
jgi:uroporphyrinogen decarboxylase